MRKINPIACDIMVDVGVIGCCILQPCSPGDAQVSGALRCEKQKVVTAVRRGLLVNELFPVNVPQMSGAGPSPPPLGRCVAVSWCCVPCPYDCEGWGVGGGCGGVPLL